MKLIHLLVFALVAVMVPLARPENAANAQGKVENFTPPDIISLKVPPGKTLPLDLPGFVRPRIRYNFDASAAENGRLRKLLLIQLVDLADRHLDGGTSWNSAWEKVEPGQLVPIAGSLYRWDQDNWELKRVDQGTVPLEHATSRAIFNDHFYISSSNGGLQVFVNRFGEPVGENEAASVDVRIFGKEIQIGKQALEEDNKRETLRLKLGDVITTEQWQIKVLRILQPDPQTHHPGWVELAMQQKFLRKFHPPNAVSLKLPEGKPGYRELPGYGLFGMHFRHDAVVRANTGQLRVFSVSRSADKPNGGAGWIWDFGEVEQGELVPLAGSLYRWDQEKWELQRIDSGPILVEKMFDPVILTNVIRFGNAKDRLQIDKVRFGEPVGQNEAESVDIRIYGNVLRIGDRQIEDNRNRSEPFNLKRGEVINTPEWRIEISRILRPDPKTKHPGWVELDVTHRPAE